MTPKGIADVYRVLQEQLLQKSVLKKMKLTKKRMLELLKGSAIKVCTAVGFPYGAATTAGKVAEIKEALINGAEEIDVAMCYNAIKSGDIEYAVRDLISCVDAARHQATIKAIYEQGIYTEEEKRQALLIIKKSGADFRNGRVYGPHGNGLVVANGSGADYDDAVSQRLTLETREANLRVRELGFKPYIAPGLSSAAVSVLRTLRGEAHYGAVPLDGAYFGCVSRLTPLGVLLQREEICAPLMERIAEAHRELKEFAYE